MKRMKLKPATAFLAATITACSFAISAVANETPESDPEVNEGSTWLLIRSGTSYGNALEKIEMQSRDQCEAEGLRIDSNDGFGDGRAFYYVCVSGK
tara:strand:- start:31 stop:318 length:288 start_codon:yes stop_codon:yes gene_type:complete